MPYLPHPSHAKEISTCASLEKVQVMPYLPHLSHAKSMH